jgi:phosphomannomutase/phosphoglucomutase
MKELKDITLNEKFIEGKGNEKQINYFQKIYKKDLINKNNIKKKIKAVVACGNGTAGIFAPDCLRGIGCEVIELDFNLDLTFPKYNPNPEDLEMLNEISKAVKENNADIGFGFDGDGDRVGVIDNTGNEIFSDKQSYELSSCNTFYKSKYKYIHIHTTPSIINYYCIYLKIYSCLHSN